MSTLAIDRLTARISLAGDHDPLAGRWGATLAAAAQSDLDTAWQAASMPPGIWCVRRVDVSVTLDPARPAADLRRRWCALFLAELTRLCASGSPDVVRFPHRAAAVADVVTGLAHGDRSREWAWRQLHLLVRTDPAPPAAAVHTLLRRESALVAPALATAVEHDAVAVNRLLGAAGWVEAATLAWSAAAPGSADIPPAAATRPRSPRTSPITLPTHGFGRLLTGAIRPAPETMEAWAVLMAVSESGGRPTTARLVERLEACRIALAVTLEPTVVASIGTETATPEGLVRPPVSDPVSEEAGVHESAVPVLRREAEEGGEGGGGRQGRQGREGEEDRKAEHDAYEGNHTDWAGLPFLLAVADDLGLPGRVTDDPALADRDLSWLLHHLGGLLCPAPAGDPGRLALAGVPDERDLDLPWTAPPTEAEAAALDTIAGEWTTALLERLGLPEDDPRVPYLSEWVSERAGHVLADRGWIELRLSHDTVHPDLRRAGLDLDPGWIPWLGVVLRYVYE